jgi:hypothetical protein
MQKTYLEGKISIFLFVENSFYERIIVEINAYSKAHSLKSGSTCFSTLKKKSIKIPQYHGRTDFVCAKQKKRAVTLQNYQQVKPVKLYKMNAHHVR